VRKFWRADTVGWPIVAPKKNTLFAGQAIYNAARLSEFGESRRRALSYVLPRTIKGSVYSEGQGRAIHPSPHIRAESLHDCRLDVLRCRATVACAVTVTTIRATST